MSEAKEPRGAQVIPGFDLERCAAYLEGNAGAPPREILVRAIPLVDAACRRRALDVGCGPGREAVALLQAGFEVVAFDPYETMLVQTSACIARDCPELAPRATLRQGTLEDLAPDLRPAEFGLVHAGFVLPFVLPARFDECFARLRASLSPGGILVGQFFGPDDEFIRGAAPGTMTSHAAPEVDRLLEGFEVLHREEVNRAGKVGRGRDKWWHVHHVVARRLP